jgi:hypothetical protein
MFLPPIRNCPRIVFGTIGKNAASVPFLLQELGSLYQAAGRFLATKLVKPSRELQKAVVRRDAEPLPPRERPAQGLSGQTWVGCGVRGGR